MSVFKKGFNKVDRRIVLDGVEAAASFVIPAGAFVSRVYAQNRSTTAVDLTVGNAAAGAQYLASVAVPVANGTGPGILYPRAAIALAPSRVESTVHVTLSAYPAAAGRGQVDVVIEYEELWDSNPITKQWPAGY